MHNEGAGTKIYHLGGQIIQEQMFDDAPPLLHAEKVILQEGQKRLKQ